LLFGLEPTGVGIGASLSGDPALIEAYKSGDPYMCFAIQAGLAPPGATKETHSAIRDKCKECVLGMSYGMGPKSLAARINMPLEYAAELLQKYKDTYEVFWNWAELNVCTGLYNGKFKTIYGWQFHDGPNTKSKSLLNFPMQSHGAEMLRIACILVTEAGIRVCCPVHDAILIESSIDQIEEDTEKTQKLMAAASRIVLKNLELTTDKKIVKYPDRYMDKRGIEYVGEGLERLIPLSQVCLYVVDTAV
jgi:DNA polymerase-1